MDMQTCDYESLIDYEPSSAVDSHMKECSQCKETKPFSEFYANKSRRDGYQNACKSCSNQYSKNHYKNNKKQYLEKNARLRQEARAYIRELKTQPCVDCGESYPYYVMHFDHLEDKIRNISSSSHWTSTQKLQEEIDKCEVVCANCHAERTAKRAGYSIST